MGNVGIRACIQNERWADVRNMLEQSETQRRIAQKVYTLREQKHTHNTHIVDGEQVKILHIALQHRVPLDIVQFIVQINPHLVQFPSSPSGELPLHFAARNKRIKKSVLTFLMEQYPQALEAKSTTHGQTPLHVACFSLQKIQIIKTMLEGYDSYCRNQNNNDHYHYETILNVRDRMGWTLWDVIRKRTETKRRPWLFFYRKRLRRILHCRQRQQQEQRQVESNTIATNGHAAVLENDGAGVVMEGHEDEEFTETITTEATQIKSSSIVRPSHNTSEEGLCVICWDGTADHAIIPCGHICLCTNCSHRKDLIPDILHHKCPICKLRMDRPLRVYHAGIIQ